jgi:hypothetical protein
MPRPDGVYGRAIRRLLRALSQLEPRPGPAEAWCVDCCQNGGRTVIVSAGAIRHHLSRHAAEDVVRVYNGASGPLAI